MSSLPLNDFADYQLDSRPSLEGRVTGLRSVYDRQQWVESTSLGDEEAVSGAARVGSRKTYDRSTPTAAPQTGTGRCIQLPLHGCQREYARQHPVAGIAAKPRPENRRALEG